MSYRINFHSSRDLSGAVTADIGADGNVLAANIYGLGMLGKEEYLNGVYQQTIYYITNHQGSTMKVVDSSGQSKAAMQYYSYGQVMEYSNNLTNIPAQETFSGKEYDDDGGYIGGEEPISLGINGGGIGLYCFGARYYDPEIGMFISPDPSMQFADAYSYTGGNPANMVDPTGRYSSYEDWQDEQERVFLQNLAEDRRKMAEFEAAVQADIEESQEKMYMNKLFSTKSAKWLASHGYLTAGQAFAVGRSDANILAYMKQEAEWNLSCAILTNDLARATAASKTLENLRAPTDPGELVQAELNKQGLKDFGDNGEERFSIDYSYLSDVNGPGVSGYSLNMSTQLAGNGVLMMSYSQSTGNVFGMDITTGNPVIQEVGYSGIGQGINNPEMENIKDIGPIPRGFWVIGSEPRPDMSKGLSFQLIPSKSTNLYGRDPYGFLIHAERVNGPKYLASTGCIVIENIEARKTIQRMGGGFLFVNR